jgi:uncharacterized protein
MARMLEGEVIDLMIGFPMGVHTTDFLDPLLKDADSKEMDFPAEYMFKDVPRMEDAGDPVEITLAEMDRWGVSRGMIFAEGDVATRALAEHPDRFFGCLEIDPNDISGAVRQVRSAFDRYRIKAVSSFPAGCNPQVPVSDARYYPIYQTCVDLDIPIMMNAGVPGPRVPMDCQHVAHFDRVCYDFPELRVVMRHGAEPWDDLAVKLMLKWPGLYYSPTAFAPKYYPETIIKYANSRGADKIMYGGYFPMGLSLERIFTELPNVPFREHVWPRFLGENAKRVFKLDE